MPELDRNEESINPLKSKGEVMTFTPTNAEVYYGISKGYHEMFHDALKEMKFMIGDKPAYDVLSHTNEENGKYFYYEQIQRQAMMICIVFQAFAIEAFVNLVAVDLYEEDEFFGTKFEKEGTIEKIKIIFKDKLNDRFSMHIDIFNLVKKTFALRNGLAHFKSKKIDLLAMQENPDIYNPYSFIMEHYEKIDEVVTAYPKFKALVNGLIGHDVIEKQMSDLQDMIKFNINEMFRKSFGTQ